MPDPVRTIDPRDIELPDEAACRLIRTMTPQQKLHAANTMFVSVRALAERTLRHQHPDWDDRQVRTELLRRMHGWTSSPW